LLEDRAPGARAVAASALPPNFRAMRASISTLRALLFGALLAAAGCKHTGAYVWVDDFRSTPPNPEAGYLLGPGDLLSVRVLGHEEMSSRVRVRPDGRISLPFLNDLPVAERDPAAVAEKLRADFREFVVNPIVTVTVEEPRPFTVSVAGEVTRPGVYPIDPHAGVLQALASAGGLTQYAHDDQIYVLRRIAADQPPVRIRFKYESLEHVEGQSGTFNLLRNDLVVVE
jgi:polysaccharide export outer membrane protein